MKTILINPENLSEEQVSSFNESSSARAVVFEGDKIALIKVNRDGYHKLPGGGLEKGETMEEGLVREIKEEIGCDSKVGKEFMQITEYRKEWDQIYKSHVFTAEAVGEKCEPQLIGFEIGKGFENIWVTVDEAIELIKKDKPADYLGSFVVVRDLAILEEVKKNL